MNALKVYLLFFTGFIVLIVCLAFKFNDTHAGSNIHSDFPNKKNKADSSKIIKFDHRLHIKDVGAKCQDCHIKVLSSEDSRDNLNPGEKTCSTCHDVKDKKDCKLCHYEGVFKKLKSVKREIYFSHKLHIGEVQCTYCHTDLDKVKYSNSNGTGAGFPSMEKCYDCHNNKKAPNNCDACHKNLTNLKPKDHLGNNFLNEHKIYSGGISEKNNCMMCHSDNFCQVCHSPLKYSGNNTPENFYSPYYTKETATRTDREALQKLTTRHVLNYRFIHGLDANQKGFECKTCHDPVEFCSSCHQNNGSIVTGILPNSHQQQNFTSFGVGSGGGLHAELAKKDIESCQSCHDPEGSDPTCVKCHFDNDGVIGTNPKTHDYGFLKDEKGIWHQTRGANCYVCHTDPNSKPDGIPGTGFCGYCHGNNNAK